MSDTQQDVIIYKAKGMKNAQRRFEEDLRKRQQEGWKVVSITPMGVQITVVYERDAAAGERIAADKEIAGQEIVVSFEVQTRSSGRKILNVFPPASQTNGQIAVGGIAEIAVHAEIGLVVKPRLGVIVVISGDLKMVVLRA